MLILIQKTRTETQRTGERRNPGFRELLTVKTRFNDKSNLHPMSSHVLGDKRTTGTELRLVGLMICEVDPRDDRARNVGVCIKLRPDMTNTEVTRDVQIMSLI
jgi:hypothetical protein